MDTLHVNHTSSCTCECEHQSAHANLLKSVSNLILMYLDLDIICMNIWCRKNIYGCMLWGRNSTSTLHFNPMSSRGHGSQLGRDPRHDKGQCNETNDQHHRCHTNHPSHNTTGSLLHLGKKLPTLLSRKLWWNSMVFWKSIWNDGDPWIWKSMTLMEIRESPTFASDNSPFHESSQPARLELQDTVHRDCLEAKRDFHHGW